MKYIKTFEAKKKEKKPSLYDDFFDSKIRDVDYYLDRINKKELYSGGIADLFRWSCKEKFNDMVIALIDMLSTYDLISSERSLLNLDFDIFKKVMLKNDLYKQFLKSKSFLERVIYLDKDKEKIFNFLETLGFNLNDNKLLVIATYAGNLDLVKFFIKKGADPSKREPTSYNYTPENCLDEATRYNKTPKLIKFFVEELNIPVTYRHMCNVLEKDNYEALPILLKSKNRIPDYAISNYATNSYNRYGMTLDALINRLSNWGKDVLQYIKMILDNHSIKEQYEVLNNLKTKKDFLGFDAPRDHRYNVYLVPSYLELAYEIVSKYNGRPYEDITKFITNNNEKFWLKKMKKEPSLVEKLLDMNDDFIRSYEYQKTILDLDKKNVKYIIEKLNPRIIEEYDDIPEIFELVLKKYNL